MSVILNQLEAAAWSTYIYTTLLILLWHLVVWENGSFWNTVLFDGIDLIPLFASHLVLLQWSLDSESYIQACTCVFIYQFLWYCFLLMNKVIAILALLFCLSPNFDQFNSCNAIVAYEYKYTSGDCINTKHHQTSFISTVNCLMSSQ